MATYAPPSPADRRSPRRGVWIALAVFALLAGLAAGRWLFPASTSAAPAAQPGAGGSTPGAAGSIGAPHGPATITKGVPSGYTHDQAGVATAAVNATQLVVNVAHGQADAATAAQTWIASTADDSTRAALSAGPNSPEDNQTSKLPATTRVTSYSDTAATVEVWLVSVGASGGGITAARWSTHTVRLIWENNDWKVAGLRAVQGPQPGEQTAGTGSQPPLQNGLYTYYIN